MRLLLLLFCLWTELTAIEPILAIAARPAVSRPDVVFRKMNLDYCRIPATGNEIVDIVLCDLYRLYIGEHFVRQIKSSDDKYYNECENNNWYGNAEHPAAKWKTGYTTPFAVIAHPIRRLAILYQEFCMKKQQCHDESVHKFAETVYTTLLSGLSPDNLRQSLSDDFYFSIQPQSWFAHASRNCNLRFCGLAESHSNVELVHADGRQRTQEELLEVFLFADIPPRYSKSAVEFLSKTNIETETTEKLMKEISVNPQTVKFIKMAYNSDYETFGYQSV